MRKKNFLLTGALACLALSIVGILVVNGSLKVFAEEATAKPKASFHWPKGTKAAVSLTYDDAIPSQIQNAGPALKHYGLKGTFFLQGNSESLKNDRDKWVALDKEGNELACHTMIHPCSKVMDWVKKGNALEDYTPERMSKELDENIAQVKELTSKEGPFTFAYPCGSNFIGPDKKPYDSIIAQKFLAGRTTDPGIVIPGACNFPLVPAMSKDNPTGKDLIAWVKQAQEKGGWVVLLFHGVGGDYLPVSLEAHKELLAYLAKNKKTIWTGTFGEVAGYLKKEEKKN